MPWGSPIEITDWYATIPLVEGEFWIFFPFRLKAQYKSS